MHGKHAKPAGGGKERARAVLVERCVALKEAIRDVMKYETDHILQHSLTSLRDECAWCAIEFREGADDDRRAK